MKLVYVLFLTLSFSLTANAQLANYMQTFKQSGAQYPEQEAGLLANATTGTLLKAMTPFYSDSAQTVRSKAYYLTYRKAMSAPLAEQILAISKLLEGCADVSSIVVGQNISYLKNFSLSTFDDQSMQFLLQLLHKPHAFHYKQLVMMAGYIGVGKSLFQQKLLQPDDIPADVRWAMQLALARMGNTASLDACLAVIKKAPLGNETVECLIPDIIYMRQKKGIDYCIEILNDPRTLCMSADPDKSVRIMCSYRIMEFLSPVVADFPYKTDASGSLVARSYEEALLNVREWFVSHPNYSLHSDKY
ncbi:MAG: hypothetical protein QM786_06825 [Breznakibacter sp.]